MTATRDREQERSAALDGSNRDLYHRTIQLEEEVDSHSILLHSEIPQQEEVLGSINLFQIDKV